MNLRDWLLRARALVARHRVERELDEEPSFHVERETHKLVAQGIDRDQARLKARARFGSTALAADRCRDERGTAFVDNAVHDVLYAFRMFGRAPLVGATIVLTVALGFLRRFRLPARSPHRSLSSRLFPVILIPSLIAELSLALWLLVKGASAEKWDQCVHAGLERV